MTIDLKSFPRNNIEYEAESMGAFLGTRTRGVYSANGNFDVLSNNDMTVTVTSGLAWNKLDSYWGLVIYLENDETLPIDIADGVLKRIDSVVIRSDIQLNTDYVAIIKGTLAEQPVAPAPVRNDNYQDLVIAHINVEASAVRVTQAMIDDTRTNEEVCGIMKDGVTSIPTETLYQGWEEFMLQVHQAYENAIDGTLAGELQREIGTLSNLNTVAKSNLVEAINELAFDYVISEEVVNGWTVRKWNNGRCELTNNWEQNVNFDGGNVKFDSLSKTIPLVLIDNPNTIINVATGGISWAEEKGWEVDTDGYINTINYQAYNNVAGTFTNTIRMKIEGRWK